MRKQLILLVLFPLAVVLTEGCGQAGERAGMGEESRRAKQLLQGMWSDAETETLMFKMEGDSVFYPDSTSMPAYFKVVGDTLYIGKGAGYFIEKQSEHLLWFRGSNGETVKLVKTTDQEDELVFEQSKPQIQTLTEVLKRDTVVFYDGNRYHVYIAVNPTKYKVVRHTVNDDGMDVENVYYDNIIHISIFSGADQLFSRDFRKPQYERYVSGQFLSQSVLNDMQYDHTDADGFHLNASICAPGDASCYLVEHVVSFDGKLTTRLQEY
jgi:hypothetical protein